MNWIVVRQRLGNKRRKRQIEVIKDLNCSRRKISRNIEK